MTRVDTGQALILNGVMAGYFSDADVVDLAKYAVYSLVFSAATATVWWFGDRAMTPPGMKSR